jgi:spore coat polysaccharide biosynthesis protein SpsF
MNDLWTGKFGNEYTARNRTLGVGARQTVWEALIPRGCRSVLEVGANVGANLEAIANFSDCEIYACEPNDMARAELLQLDLAPEQHIRADYADKLSFPNETAEVVFTCGVLIHIAPDKLIASMKEIYRVSSDYIICGEYFAPSEEMVPYRGHDNALWRRDYGSLWLDNFDDLHCISCMFAWKRMSGLDNLTFWTFAKGPRRH